MGRPRDGRLVRRGAGHAMKLASALWAILLLGEASACSGSKRVLANNDAAGSGGAAGQTDGGSSGAAGGLAGSGGASMDYTSWMDCGQDGGNNPTAARCICDAVNQCAAYLGWIFLSLGSNRYRVCGYHSGQCVIAGFSEVEGGGNGSRCLVPLGSNPCSDGRMLQSQIGAYCTPTYSCNVLLGDCPADPIACPP